MSRCQYTESANGWRRRCILHTNDTGDHYYKSGPSKSRSFGVRPSKARPPTTRELMSITRRVLRAVIAAGTALALGCSSAAFTVDPQEPLEASTLDGDTPLAPDGPEPSDGAQDGPGEAFLPDTPKTPDTRPDTSPADVPPESPACVGKPLGEDCMIAEPKACCSGKCVAAGGCCGIGKCAP